MASPDAVRRLEEQLRSTFEGEAWHGPAVLEVLQGVSAAQAAARPIAGAHSIWELVLHLAGTYALVLRRLAGDGRNLSPAEDWPHVPEPTEGNWQETIRALRAAHEKLLEAVRQFPEARLDAALGPGVVHTAFTQFIGMTQHDLYHAGQIALLKRALATR